MTVLFGTVEFFEREILRYLNEHPFAGTGEDPFSEITSKLTYEVKHDFVCDEKVRRECLNNLECAIDHLSERRELLAR